MIMKKTQPLPLGVDTVKDAPRLLEGRYGTKEMLDIWGTDANTYEAIMQAQITGLEVLEELHPGRLPHAYITALKNTANLEAVNPGRVRELEDITGHDVVAVNTAWGEAADRIVPGASSIINFIRTSADSTETAKAIRCMRSFEVYARSLENFRDILLERSIEWLDKPFMDQTHLYDALPTVAGRPLSYFAEMLQSDLDFIAFVYGVSLLAKWADATGNHHSATTAGINGIELQEKYAGRLGLRCMTAPAQIPGREFNADVMYALARTSGTLANIGQFIAMGRGDDMNVFVYSSPKRKKGSSAMPHKDVKGGNPTAEEQAESLHHEMLGKLATAVASIKFRYGRDLSGSASDRLDVGPGFKFSDHVARRLANVVYWLELNEGRSLERLTRTYGIVTAEQVMTYLVDPSRANSMGRKEAHDLMAELATRSYNLKRPFYDVLLECEPVTSRLSPDTLRLLTNSTAYIGQSKEIIERNFGGLRGKKTFPHSRL
jgi:adenylosuccinate lyase